MPSRNRCQYFRCGDVDIGVSKFRFPRHYNTRAIWVKNSGNMEIAHLPYQKLRTRYLCIKHFEEKYLRNTDGKRKRLLKTAVPIPFNQHPPETQRVSPLPSEEKETPTLKVCVPERVYQKTNVKSPAPPPVYHKNDDEMLSTPKEQRQECIFTSKLPDRATMEMIKVDPKLFVTCRLCLEDMGMYQITPVVQSQIKYCFDIDVNPFDSLPQLICSKCETILSEYVTIKRTFVGKQNALLARSEVQKGLETLSSCSVTQQGVVSSSQNELETPRSFKAKVNYSNALASSSESRSRSGSPPPKKKKRLTKKIPKPVREPWEGNYKRTFVCRQCNKHCSNIGTIRKHLKVHNRLYHKFKNIFNRFCTIPLEKVDEKPNHIESQNVVYDEEKIIADKGNMTYHVIFTPKSEWKVEKEVDETLVQAKQESDSSDDEILVKAHKKKRLRLLSNSSNTSNDTVCLEVDVKEQPPEIEENETESSQQPECINIDSDSDNGSIVSGGEVDNRPDPKSMSINDYKTIKRIVTSCQNKYLKRATQEIEDNISTNSEFNINNKILNIGRKLITKPGANFKGLLRFVEQRNLELQWQPLPLEAMSNKENVIRIMPKLRSKTLPEKMQWKFVEHAMEEDENNENSDDLFESEPVKIQSAVKAKKHSKTKSQKLKPHSKAKNDNSSGNSTIAPVVVSNGPTLRVDDLLKEAQEAQQAESQESIATPDSSHAILYATEKSTNDDRILLNANPVANPKQMPKKACPKSAKPANYDYDTLYSIPSPPEPSDLGVGLHMPIITSTTSLAKDHVESVFYEVPCVQPNRTANASTSRSEGHLAVASNNETQYTEASKAVPENSVPRIKVKPASELMSQRALSNLNERSAPFTPVLLSNPISMHRPAIPPPSTVNILMPPPQTQFQRDQKKGYVILDTVQFPNTKTNSPIKYVQNLLHTHNIILLDSKENIPTNFVNLIKFKVLFTQDTTSPTPVVLYLSLHAYKNQFYLGVREPNEVGFVDINGLSAGWQWEILKMYTTREDVVNKLLQNTLKLNREIHDYTNTLLCLIKSIRLIES